MHVPCGECGTITKPSKCGHCGKPYCSRECQKKDWNVHKNSCRKLKIGESSILGAGRGLFAECAYSSGARIAVYSYKQMQGHSDLFDPYGCLKVVHGMNELITGDPNPKDAYLAAQLANDGCVRQENLAFVENTDKVDGTLLQAAEAFGYAYATCFLNLEANNTTIHFDDDGTVIMIATRPIRAGEELLLPYGLNYWLKCASLAEHRGFAQEARQIYHAVSIGVDAALKNSTRKFIQPKDIFSFYTPDAPQTIPSLERIALLFGPPGFITFKVTHPEQCQQTVARLNEELEAIAEAPLNEFYDKKHRLKPHHRSTKLYAQLALAQQTDGFEIHVQCVGKTFGLVTFLASIEDEYYRVSSELEKCDCHLEMVPQLKKLLEVSSRD